MHAKIKNKKLWPVFSLMYVVKKIHHFLSSIKKDAHKENWFLFSASRCCVEVKKEPGRYSLGGRRPNKEAA